MPQSIKVGDNFIDAILDPECLEESGTIKACWVGKLIACEDETDEFFMINRICQDGSLDWVASARSIETTIRIARLEAPEQHQLYYIAEDETVIECYDLMQLAS